MFFVLGAVAVVDGPRQHRDGGAARADGDGRPRRASKIPLFLMAIMVGNGANAGALSPFAPTGIIVNGLMARNQLPGLEVQTYLYNLAAHAAVAFAGYAIFGGLKLFGAGSVGCGRREDGRPAASSGAIGSRSRHRGAASSA